MQKVDKQYHERNCLKNLLRLDKLCSTASKEGQQNGTIKWVRGGILRRDIKEECEFKKEINKIKSQKGNRKHLRDDRHNENN